MILDAILAGEAASSTSGLIDEQFVGFLKWLLSFRHIWSVLETLF